MSRVMRGFSGFFLMVLITVLASGTANSQTVSFSISDLAGENLVNPTSLQFGPDGRLYVSQQDGRIMAYTVVRNGANNYAVTATETIDLIKEMPNHNDDGTENLTLHKRQVTGILVKGTFANPVIYVTSSDPRIGGGTLGVGNNRNLDTNSGVISKLTWNGTSWDKIDLVRGLPRSEENHSINGLQLDEVNNILYLAQGSNTNMGAPSNNFIFLPEYALSTAILSVDLNAIGNTTYDLPTLDDENRAGVNDLNDPFGGDDGRNQAMLVPGGPVQVYSPGWRNNYDLVITEAGKMYSCDNGPNAGWGGPPTNCSNDTVEPGNTYCDALHYISGPGYYAGFPNPTRANRANTFNASNPQSPIPAGMENPAECSYILPGNASGAMATICSSTNGLCEYRATNFSSAMKGNLLAVSFNGKLTRFKLNASGTGIATGGQTVLASNFGTTPLDVTAQGDNDVFPGTIWIATYGSGNITVLEPNDFVNCGGDLNSYVLDNDADGYSNGDESDNDSDPCTASSIPDDFDHDYISDLNDPDDDNDGIMDDVDIFALDPNNGSTTTIPVVYSFDNSTDGGIGNWGFTGVMMNGIDNYHSLYDLDKMTVGGAALKFTIDEVTSGDAYQSNNNQMYAYQFGAHVGAFPFDFEVSSRVMGPFAGFTPQDYQSMGMYIGTGDQDNYLKIVCAANGGAGGLQVMKEVAGLVTENTTYSAPILGAGHVNLYLTVDRNSSTVQPKYSIDGGVKTNLGAAISIPSTWIQDVLATGFIATSRGAGSTFPATWDYISIVPIQSTGDWVYIDTTHSCTGRDETSFVQAGQKFYLMGGRGVNPVDVYDYTTQTWSQGGTPPKELHHFQAVELNGLIYVVCGFTGSFPSETPLTNVYIYDPKLGLWYTGATIPAARRRGSAGVAVYNGKIYIVSGITNGHLSGWVTWVDSYDPTTNEWKQLSDAPHARDHFHVALHNGKLYAIGGRNSGYGGNTFEHTIPEVDVYDIQNDQWETLPSPDSDIPTQRAGACTSVLGDEILVIGGESNSQSGAHKNTEAFDVNTYSWRTLDNLNTGRHGTQSIVSNYGVYVCSGTGNRGGSPILTSMEAFYLYGPTQPTGIALSSSTLTKSVSAINFGSVNLGFSKSDTLTISNTAGNQAIVITGITKTGDASFSFTTPVTFPIVLNQGSSMKIPVKFEPLTSGAKTGSLTIQHGGINGPSSIITLNGTGAGLSSVVRINAGGPTFTNASNELFQADVFYSAGTNTSSTTQPIANTVDDALYQTERYGNNFSYNIPVTNGTYTVKLHFAEIWAGAQNAGVRVFSVKIEGVTVLTNYDIYADAGNYTAKIKTFSNITVSDQQMDIQFIASANNAKVSAIEVISAAPVVGILAAAPSAINFGQVDVSTTSSPRTITLSNTGGQALTISGVSLSGTNAAQFTHNFSSNITINPGDSANINITFSPTSAGSKTATLSLVHSGNNSPVTVSLSGTGNVPEACGWFVENNGVVIMEVESEVSTEAGWRFDTLPYTHTGSGYYTWTGANYYYSPGHGTLTYQFKITNPGRYRFRLKSRNPSATNTDANDIWVRFPDHGATIIKSGNYIKTETGWFKVYQNNLNAWTFNTWHGEAAFNEIYGDFLTPGIYSIELSGRSQGFSIDRLTLQHVDIGSSWNASGGQAPQSSFENCPTTPLVWYRDADKDMFGKATDSVLSTSKPTGYVLNNTDCDDNHNDTYPGAPELLDGRDNDCDGVADENIVLTKTMRINCGGTQYVTIAGDTFVTDMLYTGPSQVYNNFPITDVLNTDDDKIYKSFRRPSGGSPFKYYFQVDTGVYRVKLHFAEIHPSNTNPGTRVFNVDIENVRVLDHFDIVATHGFATAATYTFDAVVMDGVLDIVFSNVVGYAAISAIEVIPVPNTPPTFTINPTTITDNEDFAGTKTITVTPNTVPAAEAWQTVTYSLSPASVSFANVSINSSNGQVSITSVPNAFGSQVFTITANDGQPLNNIATKTFTLTVNSVNDAPAFTLSGDVSENEDFVGTRTVTISPASVPADETNQVVTYSLSPASVSFANVSINSSTGLVSITSVSNASGTQLFTVTANDGQAQNNTYSQTFTLTVSPVNDAPTLDAIANPAAINEDAGSQIVNLSGISAGGNESQTLVVTAVSDNPSLIPNPTINYTSPNTTGSLSYAPLADQFGSATITVTVNDGQPSNNTVSRTFTVVVNAVNDFPTLNAIADPAAINEDAGLQTVNLSGISSGASNEIQTLSVTAVSDNPALIPNPTVTYTSANATGSLSYTPVANVSGSAVITVTVNDGQSVNNTFSRTFTVVVNSVNDAPVFTLSGDVTVNEDFATTETVTVTPGFVPADEAAQVVSYSLSPVSVSFANVSINSATGEVTITSIADKNGSQLFTITANDGQTQNNTYSQTFTLTVSPVNDAPTLDAIANPAAINEDAGSQIVNLSGISAGGNESQTLVVTAVSDNPSLIPNPTVNYTSPNTTGSLSYAPLADQFGSATITVTVNDGQSSNNTVSRAFTVVVNAVNDFPTLNAIANPAAINEDAGLQTVNLIGISSGASNEIQTLSITAVSNNPSLIPNPTVTYTSANATGSLSYTPVANVSGSAVITVTVNDGQSVNNTFSRTFTVVVNSVNDAPVFTLSGDVTVNEDFATTETVTVTPGFVPADEAAQVVSYSLSPASVSFANVSINSATGEVTITSIADKNGSQLFTITANDGQAQNNTYSQTFTLTVSPDNDFPTLDAIADLTINEDAGTQVVSLSGITAGPNESQSITVSALSSNIGLIDNPTVVYSSPDAIGSLNFAPVANQYGTVTIYVTVDDGQASNNSITKSFTVEILPVNDQPTLDVIADPAAINEDAGTQTVHLSGITEGPNETQTLTVIAVSNNPTLIPNPTVNYSYPNSTGSLSYAPLANQNGTAVIIVTVDDGQASNNTVVRTFTVNVNPVNDAPAFTLSGNINVLENFATTETVTVTPAPVPADEASQVVTYSLSPASVSFANVSINSTTGEVTITSLPNEFGAQLFTITANDGQAVNNTYSQTFQLVVGEGNNAPTFAISGDVTVDEDFATIETVNVTPDPVSSADSGQVVTYSLSPASVSFANVSINSSTGQVTITSVPDGFGTQLFTITADDGQAYNNLASQTFTLTVNSVNDAPVFTVSGDVTVNEDFATTEIVSAIPGNVPANESNQVVSYSLSPASVSFANIAFNSATGEVTITSVPDEWGVQIFTITANDGQSLNNTYSENFTLTVNPVNDAPLFTLSGDVMVDEDFATTETVAVTPGFVPANETSQVVTYSLSPASIGFANVSINSTTGEVTINSVPDASGSQLFTITANDGGISNNLYSQTFMLIVNSINDAPVFTVSGDVTVDEDFITVETVSVTPGLVPANESSQIVSYTLSPSSVSFANVSIERYTGEVTITSVPNGNGIQVFTITANDGQSSNNIATQTFTLTVNPVNDAPTLDAISNVVINEDDGPQVVSISGITAGAGESQPLLVTAVSSNPSLIPNPSVSYTSPNLSGVLVFAPVPNKSGSSTITVTVNDGQSNNNTVSRSFLVTVNPVNDPPAFVLSGNVTVDEDFATTEVVLATPSPVPADEVTQVVTYSMVPTSVNFANVAINASTGGITITSIPDMSGTQVFTVFANDGQSVNNTYSKTFTLTVNAVNDAPIFTLSGDVTVNKNFSTIETVTVAPGYIPADESAQVVTYSLSPASVSFANVSINSATGEVTITSVLNATGSQVFTVTGNDGQAVNNLATATFTLNVVPYNYAPTLNAIANLAPINEDSGPKTVNLSGITAGLGENQTLTVTAVSDNPGLIPNPTVNYISPNATGSLVFAPAPNQYGTANITVTVNDGQLINNTVSRSFTVVVNPVNDPPTLDAISSPLTISEDAGLQTVNLSGISGGPNESETVTIHAISNNTSLIPSVSVNYNAPASTGTLSFTSAPNKNGSALIIVTVDDGQPTSNTFTQIFTVVITAENDPPIFTVSGDVTVSKNFTNTEYVSVIPGLVPTDEISQVVTYSLTPSSISFANVSIDPATGEVSITSVQDSIGSQLFTITANDGQSKNNLATQTFTLTVLPVNELPTLDAIAGPIVINEDAGQQVVNLTGISAGPGESQVLTITAVSDNHALIADPVVTYSNPDATGSLRFAPLTDKFGSAVITVTVDDGAALNNIITRTFTVVVNSVNDQPTLDPIANPAAIYEDDGLQTINLSGISAGGNESDVLTVTATSNNTSLIPDPVVSYSSPAATGSLSYTPVANQNGSAVITVKVDDGQGTNNLITRVFVVDVISVEDIPVVTDIYKNGLEEKDIAFTQADFIGKFNDDDGDTLVKAQIISLPANGTLLLNGTALNVMDEILKSQLGNLLYRPNPDFSGADEFNYNSTDGKSYALSSAKVHINLNNINDAPSVFTLLTPANTSVVNPHNPIGFSWENSTDADADPLTYTLKITGDNVDTTISGITGNAFNFDGSSIFENDKTYQWFVTVTDGHVDIQSSEVFSFNASDITGIDGQLTSKLKLSTYPNPFSDRITIEFELQKETQVVIEVYNFLGQNIMTLADANLPSGKNKITWDGKDRTSTPIIDGVYFYRIKLKDTNGKESIMTERIVKQ